MPTTFIACLALIAGLNGCQNKQQVKSPVLLFLNGSREEALEVAKSLQPFAKRNNHNPNPDKQSDDDFSKGLVARHIQDDEQLAAGYFESAANGYLKSGKNREASLSLGEASYSLMMVCKYKEAEILLAKSLNLISKADKNEMPEYVKNLMEYEGVRKKQIQLAESDSEILKILKHYENASSTPPILQFEILNYFGKYWLSMMDYEPALFYFQTAKRVAENKSIVSTEALNELSRNLEKAKSKIKREQKNAP